MVNSVQTSYALNHPVAANGRPAAQPYQAYAKIPLEDIDAGLVSVYSGTNGEKVRLPAVNSIDLVFSGDLVTSNVINGSITVTNIETGVSSTTALSATTYASSHVATMGAIATKIKAVTGISDATVGGANDRTIAITATEGYIISVGSTFVVTLGSGQATITPTESSDDVFQFISMHDDRQPDTIGGEVTNKAGLPANMMSEGDIWVVCEEAFDTTKSVYVRFKAGESANQSRGQVRVTASTVALPWTNAKFRNSGSAGDLARISFDSV